MIQMHKRLADQLEKAATPDGGIDVSRLIEMVGCTYADMDRQQELAEKAISERLQAEDELRQSELFLRDLYDSVSDWSWETDTEHRLTYASEHLGVVLGAKPSAIVGFTWFELGLDELPELAKGLRADLAAGNAFRDLAFPVGPVGGTDRRTIRISGLPRFDEDNRLLGYRGVGADITREAAAERRATAAQQQLFDALECLSDAIALYDAEDRLVIYNTAYASTLDPAGEFLKPGVTFEFALRQAHDMRTFDLDGDDFETWLAGRMERHRHPSGVPFVVKLKDGRWFQSSENSTHAGGVISVRTDITLLENQQRKLEELVAERTAALRHEVDVRTRTEEALRGSRERLKGITDNIFEGVVVVDRFGQIVFANPSAKHLLGCEDIGDVEGHPLDGFLSLRTLDGDLSWDDSPWQRVLSDGITIRNDDAQFVAAQGKLLAVAYACSPLGEDAHRRAVILSFRDIDFLKQAQREALQASRLATVGQLAAGIAHEINTPVQYVGDNLQFIDKAFGKLTGIVTAARQTISEIAANPPGVEVTARFEAEIAKAKLPFLLKETPVAISESLEGVAQIARIVLSMKEFSHPGTTTKIMTDINRALESTLTVCRNVWKTAAVVDTDFDPSLPHVLCHSAEMNQVFLNLIVNAAHAIEASGKELPGRITLATRHEADHVLISVEDTGTGVPLAMRDQIFDPFFTTKEVGKGTGQGLAICRDVVVTKHGGSISVDGTDGEGAIFTVRLPIEGSELMGDDGGR